MTSFAPTLISSISHPLSATELRQLDPGGICCTSCDREIASFPAAGGTYERFKDLPSEHWAEMMEVWMCHDDPGFTAKLASQTKEGFWPIKGKVLVGGSYVLVNPEDVKRGNLLQVSTKVSLPTYSVSLPSLWTTRRSSPVLIGAPPFPPDVPG